MSIILEILVIILKKKNKTKQNKEKKNDKNMDMKGVAGVYWQTQLVTRRHGNPSLYVTG